MLIIKEKLNTEKCILFKNCNYEDFLNIDKNYLVYLTAQIQIKRLIFLNIFSLDSVSYLLLLLLLLFVRFAPVLYVYVCACVYE